MATAAIEAATRELERAWAARDVDAVMALYTDDCIGLYSDGPGFMEGKAQIREKVVKELGNWEDMKIHMSDRIIGENVGCEVGTFTCKVKGKVFSARYGVNFVKRGGKWLVKHDIGIFPTA